MTSLYELTVYVSVPPDKADYLLEKLCNTVEDYGYGWERASAERDPEDWQNYCGNENCRRPLPASCDSRYCPNPPSPDQ